MSASQKAAWERRKSSGEALHTELALQNRKAGQRLYYARLRLLQGALNYSLNPSKVKLEAEELLELQQTCRELTIKEPGSFEEPT